MIGKGEFSVLSRKRIEIRSKKAIFEVYGGTKVVLNDDF